VRRTNIGRQLFSPFVSGSIIAPYRQGCEWERGIQYKGKTFRCKGVRHMGSQPASERVSQRLKDQYAPAYLTLASIIQGVALSTLVMRVEATYPHFGAVNWLLTIATFVAFLAVWHEYLMQVLAFVWVPTLLDSLVPFAFLAGELFMAHFVYDGLRGWLLALGVVNLVGVAAHSVTMWQARTLSAENRDVARVLAPHGRIRAALPVCGTVLCVCAWALYDVLRLGQVQTVIALIAVVATGLFVVSSVPYWDQVLAYARGEVRDGGQRGDR
jgi:hypothetical protein